MNCTLCGSEIGTAGCQTPWKHPGVIVGSSMPGRDLRDAEIAALRAEVERLTREKDSAVDSLRMLTLEVDGFVSERDEARAECARVTEERDEALRKNEAHVRDRTCVTCHGLICAPMQCGRCIETERPVPGMPDRPATTALQEKARGLEAELARLRAESGEARRILARWVEYYDVTLREMGVPPAGHQKCLLPILDASRAAVRTPEVKP